MQYAAMPIFLFLACVTALAVGLVAVSRFLNPGRPGRVKQMPYESGMDPIHDTHRRFDIRFYLLAIAFLVFDVEVLFLIPWAVALRPATIDVQGGQTVGGQGADRSASLAATPSSYAPLQGIDAAVAGGLVESRHLVFAAAMTFLVLLVLGFVYDWRKGVFQWS